MGLILVRYMQHLVHVWPIYMNISLASPGALAHCLQNQKWSLGGPKMAEGVWKGVYP